MKNQLETTHPSVSSAPEPLSANNCNEFPGFPAIRARKNSPRNLGNCRFLQGRGFSLLEILLSLLIVSGALVPIFGGLQVSNDLENYCRFEEKAIFMAEREMELLKTDLLSGARPLGTHSAKGRFAAPRGWSSIIIWSPQPPEGSVRLESKVSKGKDSVKLESFLFVPISGKSN